MNTSSAEAGLELCKKSGVIAEWHIDIPNDGYNLIKTYWDKNKTHPDTIKGFLSMKVIQGLSSPTDLSDAVTEIFNSHSKATKEAQIEIMVTRKLEKLLNRIETTTTEEKGLVGPDMGWVKIRLNMINNDEKLTKKDLLEANKLWNKYGH